MKCWHCNSEVIWGGDHTYEDYGRDGDGIVSNLSCSGNCGAFYLCYLDLEEESNGEKEIITASDKSEESKKSG